jgi:hypothetical protein
MEAKRRRRLEPQGHRDGQNHIHQTFPKTSPRTPKALTAKNAENAKEAEAEEEADKDEVQRKSKSS